MLRLQWLVEQCAALALAQCLGSGANLIANGSLFRNSFAFFLHPKHPRAAESFYSHSSRLTHSPRLHYALKQPSERFTSSFRLRLLTQQKRARAMAYAEQ
jgi:hypothetical protein